MSLDLPEIEYNRFSIIDYSEVHGELENVVSDHKDLPVESVLEIMKIVEMRKQNTILKMTGDNSDIAMIELSKQFADMNEKLSAISGMLEIISDRLLD